MGNGFPRTAWLDGDRRRLRFDGVFTRQAEVDIDSYGDEFAMLAAVSTRPANMPFLVIRTIRIGLPAKKGPIQGRALWAPAS